MEREISTTLGVVLERAPAASRWADWTWSVPEVVPDAPPTDGWRLLSVEGERTRFLSSPHVLTLHHKMVEAYDRNIETGTPHIWVMLDEVTDDDAEPGWRVVCVTADPYEAQGFLDSGEGLVERVAMPAETVAWMARFLAAVPEAPSFRKRRRDRAVKEEPIFGKTPIFAPEGRRPGGEAGGEG
ncbi:DUF3305 domain-containing protein [Stappia sp.]|uniref:DUF3305 domain-containing protein n=1 Tax=Stappia sp. TaxID=1870903 RepID=UPI0032D95F7F